MSKGLSDPDTLTSIYSIVPTEKEIKMIEINYDKLKLGNTDGDGQFNAFDKSDICDKDDEKDTLSDSEKWILKVNLILQIYYIIYNKISFYSFSYFTKFTI